MWQFIFSKSRASLHTPKNFESLSRTMVWQNPYQSWIFMIAEANVVALAPVTGSKAPNVHIPQQAMM
jgi:hypothetical protein